MKHFFQHGKGMNIVVTVKPNARKSGVFKVGEGEYRVSVTAPPVDGKANDAVVQLLSEHFDVPKTSIRILRGHMSKKKVVVIA